MPPSERSERTPAPTRRFLPPSSGAAKPSLASSHKLPFQTPRSTQPGSLSPFGATPRFHHGSHREKDEIQTSFDDEDFHTPIAPKVRSSNRPHDAIEVEDDEPEGTSPLRYQNRLFTPVTKKRKTSHHDSRQAATIIISSPELDEVNDVEAYHDSDSSVSGSDLDDIVGAALTTPETNESNKMARFRATTSGMATSTPLSRPVFKSAAEEDAQHALSDNGPILPDVFSPSRRKGKLDYAVGSSADLVRSWVLNVAAQESHNASIPEATIVARTVTRDSSGRFVLVVDEDGAQWLLPKQQHQKPSAGSTTTWAELRPGTRILLKGHATKWSLHLGTSNHIRVAAYWDFATR